MSFVMIISELNHNAVVFDFGGTKSFITHRCNNGDNQLFQLIEQPDGHFVIAMKMGGGSKCIDVNMVQGPPLVCWDIHKGNNQLWRLEMVEAGLFRIISAHNGFALSMPPGAHARAVPRDLSLLPVESVEEAKYSEMNLRQLWRIFPVKDTMFPYFSDREMAEYTFRYSQNDEKKENTSGDLSNISSAGGSSSLAIRMKPGKYKKAEYEQFVISVDVDSRLLTFREGEVEQRVQMEEVTEAGFTISWPNTSWGIARFDWSDQNPDVLVEKGSIKWIKSGDLDAPRDQSLRAVRDCIDKNGFAVISGVYDPADLERAKSLCGSDLLKSVDVDACGRNEPLNAWHNDIKSKPLSSVPETWKFGKEYHCNGNKFGLAQAQFAWNARLNKRIKEIYYDIYNNSGDPVGGPNRADNEEDLCVGMDRIFYSPQASTRDRTSLWPHADINDSLNGVASWNVYQGVLYMWDSKGENNENAATVILPGSHKAAYQTLTKYGGSNGHFLTIDSLCNNSANTSSVKAGNTLALRFLSEAKRVSVRPGSLLIWNSRTLHQGWSEGRRLAVPICFEPKSRRDEFARRRKLVLAALGLPSTHWASLGVQHGDTIDDLDRAKPGSVDENGNVLALPTKMGGIESFALRAGVTKDQVRTAVNALEDTEYRGEAETKALEALIKDEVLKLL